MNLGNTLRSLPDHDLAEGTKPLERYPRAVMIDIDKLNKMYFVESTEESIDASSPSSDAMVMIHIDF